MLPQFEFLGATHSRAALSTLQQHFIYRAVSPFTPNFGASPRQSLCFCPLNNPGRLLRIPPSCRLLLLALASASFTRISSLESDSPMRSLHHLIHPSFSISQTLGWLADSTQLPALHRAWRESSRSTSRQMPSWECLSTWSVCQASLMETNDVS